MISICTVKHFKWYLTFGVCQKRFVREETLKYYATFIENPYNCSELIVATLNESYHWFSQSFEESKNIACNFRDFANGYEFSCLSDLVKASIEVDGNSVKIIFKGFVFAPEHASGSEMSFFNITYELSDKGEKLYFDNPLGEPCETSENEAINALLDTLAKIFKLCEERG
jgi:hypothetical protein